MHQLFISVEAKDFEMNGRLCGEERQKQERKAEKKIPTLGFLGMELMRSGGGQT